MNNLWSWIEHPNNLNSNNKLIQNLHSIQATNKQLIPTAVLHGAWFQRYSQHNRLNSTALKLQSGSFDLSKWQDKLTDSEYPDDYPEILWEIYHKLIKRKAIGLKLSLGWDTSTHWPIQYFPVHGETNLVLALKHAISTMTAEKIAHSKKIIWDEITAILQPVYNTDYTIVIKPSHGQLLELEVIHGDGTLGLLNDESPTTFTIGQNSQTLLLSHQGNQKHVLNNQPNQSNWIPIRQKSLSHNPRSELLNELCDAYTTIKENTQSNWSLTITTHAKQWFIQSATQINFQSSNQTDQTTQILGTGQTLFPGKTHGYLVKISNTKIRSDQIVLIDNWQDSYKKLVSQSKGIIIKDRHNSNDLSYWLHETGIPCIINYSSKIPIPPNHIVYLDASKGILYLQKQISKHKIIESTSLTNSIIPNTSQVRPFATKLWPLITHSINPDNLNLTAGAVWNISEVWKKLNVHPIHAEKSNIRDLITHEIQSSISLSASQLTPRPLIIQLAKLSHHEWRHLNYGKVYEKEYLTNLERYLDNDWQLFTEINAIRELRNSLRMTNLWIEIVEPRSTTEIKQIKKELASIGMLRSHSFKLWVEIESWYLLDQIEELASIGIDGVNINWINLLSNYLNTDDLTNFSDFPITLISKLQTTIKSLHQHDLQIHLTISDLHSNQLSQIISVGFTNIRTDQKNLTQFIPLIQQAESLAVQNTK